jgi:hypothetical protein
MIVAAIEDVCVTLIRLTDSVRCFVRVAMRTISAAPAPGVTSLVAMLIFRQGTNGRRNHA